MDNPHHVFMTHLDSTDKAVQGAISAHHSEAANNRRLLLTAAHIGTQLMQLTAEDPKPPSYMVIDSLAGPQPAYRIELVRDALRASTGDSTVTYSSDPFLSVSHRPRISDKDHREPHTQQYNATVLLLDQYTDLCNVFAHAVPDDPLMLGDNLAHLTMNFDGTFNRVSTVLVPEHFQLEGKTIRVEDDQ